MSPPKNRGCFQCTKRRISCDAAYPVCVKCQKKGIECSGPGRFRFSGVAAKGRLKGCRIPVAEESQEPALEKQRFAEGIVPKTIRWDGSRRAGKTRSRREDRSCDHGGIDERVDVVTPTPGSMSMSISPWIAPLSAHTRMLFSHFASEVAPVMVVLDSISNGYRDHLLPLACEDEMLQRTVSIVAAQHLALQQPHFHDFAESGRAAIISQLRRESSSPERVLNLSTWATLVVLLVGETITGSPEYNHLLRTLICLAPHTHQITSTPAAQFLTQQTHMFEFLGHPLLNSPNPSPSQDITTTTTNTNTTIPAALSHPPTHYLDWLDYSLPPTSSHTRILNLTYEAFQTASELYSSPPLQTQNTLNRLRALVSQIDPNAPGSHALVWVCFLAAAASTDFSDRSFFTARMGGVYAKTRFRNITVGIDSLPRIWDAQAGARAGEMENDKMSWCNWWNGSGDLGRLASSLVM